MTAIRHARSTGPGAAFQPNIREHCVKPFSRSILGAISFLCIGLLASCGSTRLHKAATRAGIAQDLPGTSALAGTFDNTSLNKFGPQHVKLWELLSGTQSPWSPAAQPSEGSSFGHRVRISEATPGILALTLLADGPAHRTLRLPYELRGPCLHLRHRSDFNWLPLGYRRSSSDLAITAVPGGDLVVLYRYRVSGVTAIGSAGDSGVLEFRFRRLP
jgi:hypothetical protein